MNEGTREIYLITSNRGKVSEFQRLAEGLFTLRWIDRTKPEIQSNYLEDIVRFGCMSLFTEIRKPLLVEDAGLFIEALNGFPGPYTSYVRKTLGIEGVLKLMHGVEDRKAKFVSAQCYVDDMRLILKTGEVVGRISLEARGERGFGFDPIFIPLGYELTFGELGEEIKNKISHRGKAFADLVQEILRTNL